MSERTTRVHVGKAFSLPASESVEDFTRRLRDSLTAHMMKKLKIKERFDLFVSEIFADFAIVHVFPSRTGKPPNNTLFSVPFQPDGNGFEFGEASQVKRQVTFVPVIKRARSFWE